MKKILFLTLLCLTSFASLLAQPKPGKKTPVKTAPGQTTPNKTTPAKPIVAPKQTPAVVKPKPKVAPKKANANTGKKAKTDEKKTEKETTSKAQTGEYDVPKSGQLTPNSEGEANLRRIEQQNAATLNQLGEKATYYRMDRASVTVLPVQLFVPGLHAVDKDYKPVYTPRQLFDARRIKEYQGNVVISEKHFSNKIGFDTDQMMGQILKDSAAFYSLLGLKRSLPVKGKNQNEMEELSLSDNIGKYLTQRNVGTDVLNIWTNKSILMDRIMYSRTEADNRERVDPKKLTVFENLLKKNYVFVLVVINPRKVVEKTDYGTTIEMLKGDIEGFLYEVDSEGLDINNIKEKHPLKFVTSVSMGNQNCDPRSEELIEALGGTTMEEFTTNVKSFIATNIRNQALAFYKNKEFVCAKNYFEYVQKAHLKDTDPAVLKSLIADCARQISKGHLSQDKTCMINEDELYENWEYVQGATNLSFKDLETRIEQLKIKSYVFKTDPYITVEIGKKQGVYTDQRFMVYRKTLDENGNEGRKRVGTLRAVKVADNTDKFHNFKRRNILGDTMSGAPSIKNLFASAKKSPENSITTKLPSQGEIKKHQSDSLINRDLHTMSIFKQIDGGHLEPYDLVMQNEDNGYGVQAGYGTRMGIPSLIFGLDFRLASVLKSRMPLSGLKVGANLALPQADKIYENVQITKGKTALWDVYLARELYLSRKFDLKPFIGLSAFKDNSSFMLGSAAYINIIGKNSDIKVKLAPEVAYVFGFPVQYSVNLRFDF